MASRPPCRCERMIHLFPGEAEPRAYSNSMVGPPKEASESRTSDQYAIRSVWALQDPP